MIGMTSHKFLGARNTFLDNVWVAHCVWRLCEYQKWSEMSKYMLRAVVCLSMQQENQRNWVIMMELDANWMNKLESSDTFPFVELLITSNSHQLKYLASHLSLHNVHKFFLMVKHITNFIPEHYMDFHGKPTACCSQFDLTLARRCLCCIQLHTVHLSMLGCATCVHCFLSIDWSLFSYFSPSV
jgi:hypothetical protein